MMNNQFTIKPATINDAPVLLAFIKELAAYEKLPHEVVATEEILRKNLFSNNSHAEAVIGYYDNVPVGFALFFHNFSTFLGKPGLYLEDLYVKPEMRGKGIGKKMLAYLAQLAQERNCARFEWSVLNWNKPAIEFYKSIGAKPMHEWTVQRITGAALDELAKQFDSSVQKS